jgi:hypothetical protein
MTVDCTFKPVTFSTLSLQRTKGCPTSRSFICEMWDTARSSTLICQERPRLVPETWALSIPLTALNGHAALPFVIPTEAYPDFLLRSPDNDHVCGSP